ncbi:SMI1/KNR4 family protein [Ideonella sp. B7]|uniref:SMI1/KNR4 family protein n=1 Tax=Ideonella benzenivorans TaxID=2831643 RepID=UPI001CEDA62E|nr:SMI1/KNR4 family protein [Ideonella benzenivorans]MCA6215845.1 SMI1/KNR4 family protein [Ideonella benzenivorans]
MHDVWYRLQQACERLRPDVPRGGLNPPAPEAQIRTVEALVGYRFPDDLREAYRHFNGSTGRGLSAAERCPPLLLVVDWADLDALALRWSADRQMAADVRCDEDEDAPWRQPYRPFWRHPGWLPIGVGSTDHCVYADVDPAGSGQVGQLLDDDFDGAGRVVAPSLSASLERLLDALDDGRMRWDEEKANWVDRSGATVRRLDEATGPWPPTTATPRRGVRRRPKPPARPRLMPVALPDTFPTARAQMQAWAGPLPVDGKGLPLIGASSALIEHVETELGHHLPLEARVCWSVLDGARRFQHLEWKSLHEVLQQLRYWRSWLVLQAPANEHPRPPAGDDRLQPGPWRADWLPVGQQLRHIVCLDFDPGPAGTLGQLIVVERPGDAEWAGRPPEAPRWIAAGLMPWLWQVTTGASSPEGFENTASALLWHSLCGPAPVARRKRQRAWSPEGWQPDPEMRGPQPLLPRRWHVHRSTTALNALRCFAHLTDPCHASSHAITCARRWARGGANARGLVVAPIGSGTSSLLKALVAEMREAQRLDPCLPLPIYIDAQDHAGITDLSTLWQAEAQRRGADATGLMRAAAAGQCALILDHVEALLDAWPLLWTAFDQEGPSSRLLLACASEAFVSMRELQRASNAFLTADHRGAFHGWLAAPEMQPFSQGTVARTCRRLGHRIDPAASLLVEGTGDLPQRLGYLVLSAPWSSAARQGGDANRANSLETWWGYLAQRQRLCEEQQFKQLVTHAVASRWRGGEPLPPEYPAALRPWLCAALGIPMQEDEVHFARALSNLPLLLAMEQGDDGTVVDLLMHIMADADTGNRPCAHTLSETWRARGHTTAWTGAASLLRHEQPPEVAGFLLALGAAMASAMAASSSQGAWPDDEAVAAQLRQTLPYPLPLARTAGADLSGQDLLRLHLPGVDLRGACLDGADLAGAHLQDARLDGASMRATRLEGALLHRARLDGVLASDGCWRGANFTDASAEGLLAERCDLRQLQWNQRWSGAQFVDCITTDGATPATHEHPPCE